MEKIKNAFYIVLGFLILLSIPAGLYFVGAKFFGFIAQLDKAVAASIIAASGTAFAAVFTVVIGQSINKKREIADAHRTYKIKLYSEFVEFTIDWVFKHADDKKKIDEATSQKELQDYFIKFSKELMLWASPGVIKAWSSFRENAGKGEKVDTLIRVNAIFKEMRKDLGNSNFGLEKSALIMLFLRKDEEES